MPGSLHASAFPQAPACECVCGFSLLVALGSVQTTVSDRGHQEEGGDGPAFSKEGIATPLNSAILD